MGKVLTDLLSAKAYETDKEYGFDIIIDDALHMAELTCVSFWHLFLHHLL